MFVTSWWKFMESQLPPATSWTLTPVQKRSSVGISSSILKMQFSKTTYMRVRSMLSKGNFLWHVVLKSYSLCCLGRFIRAILQPILSTLKSGWSHNSGVNSSESPPTKRCKQDERDLRFLLVKNKDGQDCLFVDLGKRNTEMIRFSLLVFTLCHLQKQEFTPRTEISGCTSRRRLGRGPRSRWQRTTRFTPNPRKVGLQRKACFWLP